MNIINLIGLSSGLAGSIILAFSLKSIVTMLNLLVLSHELENSSKHKVTGLDEHMEKSHATSKCWTFAGLSFLVAGYFLQIIAIFINK